MEKFIKKVDIYFVILAMELFIVLCFMHFNGINSALGTLDFIVLGALFGVIVVSYFQGVVGGLICSAFIIFAYVSYILYMSMSSGIGIEPQTYIWIIAIPLSGYLSGSLSSSINKVITIYNDLQKDYDELVTIDGTTGFSNVRGFYMDVDRAISIYKRHGEPFSLMIIKVMYYDEISGILGPKRMKKFLMAIGDSITNSTRNEDEKYKLTNDTFAILMQGTDEKSAEIVKRRIKDSIKEFNFSEKQKGKNIKIDLKIGLLEYTDDMKSAFEFKTNVEKEIEYDV